MGYITMDSHSDLHNINGELVMTTNVPGHEGVGRVVKGEPRELDNVICDYGVDWTLRWCSWTQYSG